MNQHQGFFIKHIAPFIFKRKRLVLSELLHKLSRLNNWGNYKITLKTFLPLVMGFGEVGADSCSYNSHKSKIKRFELIWEYQNVQKSLL